MLNKVMNGIRRVERVLLAVIMLAMAVLFFVNVAVRQLSPSLATELAWIEEATLFALAWMVFVGLGLALERRRHIAMTAVLDKLGPGTARAIELAINVTGVVVCAFLAKIGFDLAVFI